MPRRIRIGLIVVFAVVIAYPAAAWVIGIVVERQNDADEQKRLAEAPYVVRTQRDYHRGIFSSTERSTYQISLPTAKGPADSGASGSWHVTTQCVLHHGPLPRLRTLALAFADCVIELPPEVPQEMKAALEGKSLVELHIRMGWLGGSTTAFTSPALTLKMANGAIITWRGISGTLAAGRGLAAWSGTFTAPGLTVDYAATHADIGSLTVTADMRRAYDSFDIGKMSMKLVSATIHSAEPGKDLMLRGMTITADSSQSGDYVDSAVELTVDALEAKQFSATRAGYAVRLSHAHGPSLAALSNAMRDMQREGLAANGTAFQAKLRDGLREHGFEVLAHDPVLEIPRIGFVTPEGEARLSAKLSAPGLTREELLGPAPPAAVILRRLQAEVDLSIDPALLDRMLSGSQNPESARQQLAMLQRQGYVKQAGTHYTVHLTYDKGKAVVNGLPFPPAARPAP